MGLSEKVVGDPENLVGVSEHSIQVALMAACAQYVDRVPELEWLHAVPNGGGRGSDKRSAMIAGATMKAEGTKSGVADLSLPVARHGYHGFYIEMKKPGSKQSPDQVRFEKFVTENGYLYAVFDTWYSAFRALQWYLGFEHTRAWLLPS